jgi:hypothetical protein
MAGKSLSSPDVVRGMAEKFLRPLLLAERHPRNLKTFRY